jgi:hypothetical protein
MFYQSLMINAAEPAPGRNELATAEIPVFAHIRFVANPKLTGPGLVK